MPIRFTQKTWVREAPLAVQRSLRVRRLRLATARESVSRWIVGVGDGNRTHNVRSHSPVLCQLSYSHRILSIIATRLRGLSETPPLERIVRETQESWRSEG